MKHLPTLASVIALIVAGFSIRFVGRQLPWTVAVYIAAQCLFALIGWWGIQRDVIRSNAYLNFFALGFTLVLLSAVAFAIKIAFVHPKILGIYLIFGALFQSSGITAIVVVQLIRTYRNVPAHLLLADLQGFVLCFCGTVNTRRARDTSST